MTGEKFKLKFAVYVIPRNGDQVLLSLRKNTGYMDGSYSLVAGHVEAGETAEQAVIREATEEAGVTLTADQLKYVFTMHRLKTDPKDDYVDVFFECTNWNGEFINNEPEKCGGLDWFDIHNLPENTIPYVADVLGLYPQGERFMSKRETPA